jgi:hypothetical protein
MQRNQYTDAECAWCSSAQQVRDKQEFITTLNLIKYCNYLLTKLTRRSMLKKLLSSMLTSLHIPFVATEQGNERYFNA